MTIVGNNFGAPPSSVGTNVELLGGPTGTTGTPKLLNLIGGSNTQLTATIPGGPAGLLQGSYTLIVANNGGASNTAPFTITAAC